MNPLGILKKIRINIDLTIALLAFMFIVTLSIMYLVAPMTLKYIPHEITKEVIIFFTALVGGSSAIYSAYYTGAGLHQRVRQEKIKQSYEFMHRIYDKELTKFWLKFQQEFHPEKMPPDDFYDRLNEDVDMATTVRSSLNLFETLSIAIQEDYADEIVAHAALVMVIIKSYDTLLPYIAHIRNKHNDKNIYCELEKLALSWKRGKYLNSNNNVKVEYKPS